MNSLLVRSLVALFVIGGLLHAQEPAKENKKTKVAILAFSGVEILDFAGPAEVFGACRDIEGNRLFEVYTVGVSKDPIDSMHFVSLNPKYDPSDAPDPDVVVIPGGNVDSVMSNEPLMKWLSTQRERKCILFSVCNGASVLAKLGVLEGLEVATHHSNRDILEWLEPKAKCVRDKRFIDHGQIITTAGVSAGIDGALHLVQRIKGESTAVRSAISAEFDYWEGFAADRQVKRTEKYSFLNGREYNEEREWAVYRLLRCLHEEGVDAAARLYSELKPSVTGHDLEMIEEAGLVETGMWLLVHGRDKKVGMKVLQLAVATNPKSSTAYQSLATAYVTVGEKEPARQTVERGLKECPDDKLLLELLQQVKE